MIFINYRPAPAVQGDARDMKLEDQLCSLELSKKLKELGVKQESVLWWGGIGNMGIWCDHVKNDLPSQETRFTWYSAFTVAELGEMLPKRLEGDHPLWYLTIHCNDNYYNVVFETFNGKIENDFESGDKNEANARAKMLIYLIENKLLPILQKKG